MLSLRDAMPIFIMLLRFRRYAVIIDTLILFVTALAVALPLFFCHARHDAYHYAPYATMMI